ncbi:hypothetical protein SJI19_06485 [Acerihabitans sp. TG2]|uniref:hypothetical protein n=1 Tax=Acerihabitans sp. TG2 TaxID=3096008 RepID=UPI002B2374EE|nr:hypothetical protein [Acerihabitans sp. TG2]MEA9390198.1 hypothetical protein [Acerihabitans sp. TG2]
MTLIKKLYLLIAIYFLIIANTYSHEFSSSPIILEGYIIPAEILKIVNQEYENLSIINYQGIKYLAATTGHEINKCSVLFEIKGRSINPNPTIGLKEQICNISIHDDKIVSSWRDSGKWNDDVYKVNSNGKWELLFRDSCIGCNQVKRTYFANGKITDSVLMTTGDDFSERNNLVGQVTVDKTRLFKTDSIDTRLKSYLIKGDVFTLIDMSNNGDFYKIRYKTASGKNIISWIKSDDFSFQ